MLTVNIYLNDNQSGATRFYYYGDDSINQSGGQTQKSQIIDILPQTGQCVMFQQLPHAEYIHSGLKVESGLKYLMRTDVMFRLK